VLRFGSELIFALCEMQNIEIVIINKGEPPTFEEELAQDVIEIITVFSARLYGSRSHMTKRLLNELTEGKETEASSDPTEVGRRVRTRDGIVRKAMSPEDVPDEDVRNLLSAMQVLHMRAMTVYARLIEEHEHDAPGP
jgi:hypothetical protein